MGRGEAFAADTGSGVNMKSRLKTRKSTNKQETHSEYNFKGGARGKYARRYARGTNVVVLDPDVARAFPNAAAVNQSLRALRDLVRLQKRSRAVAAHK